MADKKLVSVIIPAYNHEKYVQEAIKSIINQTYKNIELIVIDDGSKDSTWQKIQDMQTECEQRFIRTVFKTKENEGTTCTLNKLLSETQGEYIYLIASDDMAKPEAIEIESEFLLKNNDYALVVGDDEIIDGDGKRAYWDKERNLVYDKKEAEYITFVDFLQKLHKFNFTSKEFGSYNRLSVDNHVPNGFLIKKSIFEVIGYFTPDAPLEDWWLMMQISKYAKMKYIDKILFSYRWHNLNTIKNSQKMQDMCIKNKKTEEKILQKLDLKKCLPEISDFVKYGYKYKSFGINNIFEISKYKNKNYKTKKITFLCIPFVFRKKI